MGYTLNPFTGKLDDVGAGGSSIFSPFAPGALTKPTTASFTKQEGVAASSTMANVSRGVALTVQGAGAIDRMALLEVTPGGSTWTATAQICHQIVFRSFMFLGLAVRDSSTGRLHVFTLCGDSANSGQRLRTIRYTNMTTFSAEDFNQPAWGSYGSPIWFRLVLDATNLTASISSDGENFMPFHQIAKNSFVANIDRVGVVFDVNQNASLQNIAETILVSSWSLT